MDLAVVFPIVLLLLLLITGVPVGFALLAAGVVGLVWQLGLDVATAIIGRELYLTMGRYTLIVIPMFVAMGMFAKQSGLAEKVYDVLERYSHRIPGGAGVATILACAGFGATSGSSVAAVATIGKLSIDQMRAQGYPLPLAAGIVASGSTLAVLIPPSLVLVIYGQITGESIGQLLIAGIVPGVISALIYIGFIIWRSRKLVRPDSAEAPGSRPEPLHHDSGGRAGTAVIERQGTKPELLGVLVRIGVLFTVLVGGIYFGVVTVTEASGIGAIAAAIILWIDRRKLGRKGLGKEFSEALRETASLTGMIYALLIGSTVFSLFVTRAGIPRGFTEWITGLDVPSSLVVVLMLLALIPMGMVMDGISMLVIAVPLMYPVVANLGFDGIWFGILAVKMVELSLITPPVGVNVYIVAGASDELTVEQAYRGVAPFYLIDSLTIAAMFVFPAIVTFLPSLSRI